MSLTNKRQSFKKIAPAKSFFYLLSIILLLISVNGNFVLANHVNTNQIQFVKPQESSGNKDQTHAAVFNSYLPLIMNGLPAPSEFNKNAPASGTTGTTLAPVLSWNVSTNATKYDYCYDTTNDGTCSNWVSTGTNNYVGLWALQPATTYYWQVRAWNGTYGPTYANGSASAYWSFTTMVMVPGAFNKNAPASGSTGVSLSPVLSWNVSTNATKYEYCYDTSNDGTCSNWVSTGTNNYIGLWGLQPATTYYWQVRAWNGTYGPTYANGSASAYWSFTTMVMVPGAFNKNAPANGSTGVSLSPVLSWNTSTNATKYEYCYDTSNDGTCSNWISTGTNNWAGLSGLQAGTTYYWQVRSWNGTYGPTYANGSASAYWSFTTVIMQPGAFNKASPVNGYDGTTMSPVLSWTASTNATKYEYCYDTTNDGSCSNWISTGTANYVGLWALQPATTYYWQVRSWNGTYGPTYANGSASAFWHFSTLESGVWIMDNCSIYLSPSSSYYILTCEVYNNTTTNIEFVELGVYLYDSSFNYIGEDYSYTYLSIVHPQEKACVEVWIDYLPNLSYYDTFGSYYVTDEGRPSLSISNHSGSADSYGYDISGIITNNYSSTVNYVNAVSTLYDSQGLALACDYGYINLDEPHLAPGQQSSFDISTWWLLDPYAVTRYKLQADGWIPATNSRALPSKDNPPLGNSKPIRSVDPSINYFAEPDN